jgi:hypothetical protein
MKLKGIAILEFGVYSSAQGLPSALALEIINGGIRILKSDKGITLYVRNSQKG